MLVLLHQSNKLKCEKNHTGSSPSMELEGVLRIWKRSQEKLHLRYTEVIPDGDSKTVKALKKVKPYGEV